MRNFTVQEHGTTWYFGADAPKAAAVAAGRQAGHRVFLEQVTTRGRRFGSLPDVPALVAAFGQRNCHLYEILVAGRPVKAYLDVEWDGDAAGLDEVLQKLALAFDEVLGLHLNPGDVRVSCATGPGETGRFKGRTKHSYHVVVDNGWAFADTQAARAFVDLAFPGDERVDRVPYGRNQSFKLVWNSKLDSDRVQLPLDGHSQQQHMVSAVGETFQTYRGDLLREAAMRSTRRQDCVPAPVTPPGAVPPSDDLDVHSVRDLLACLPNGPSKDRKQPFQTYLAVACICRNEGEPFETLESWAGGYEAFSREKTWRIWESLARRLDGFDIRTLRAMVRKVHPGLLQSAADRYVQQAMVPTVDLTAAGVDLVEYWEPRMQPMVEQAREYKHVMIRGAMGTGKTHQIMDVLRCLQPSSVLVVTPRQLFARSMLGTLRKVLPDMRMYRDVPKGERPSHPFMVCQLESLWSLNRTYDLVILDESESVLYQFSSPTIVEFDDICGAFQTILRAARTVIHADAFLGDRTILTCASVDPDSTRCLIWNRWQPSGRRAYSAGQFKAGKEGLKRAAHQLRSESNVVVSASKELAKELVQLLEPAGPVAFVSSDSSDATKRQLEDVEGFLQPFKHFVYTGAITVGTSYDRRDHFDNLLMCVRLPAGMCEALQFTDICRGVQVHLRLLQQRPGQHAGQHARPAHNLRQPHLRLLPQVSRRGPVRRNVQEEAARHPGRARAVRHVRPARRPVEQASGLVGVAEDPVVPQHRREQRQRLPTRSHAAGLPGRVRLRGG